MSGLQVFEEHVIVPLWHAETISYAIVTVFGAMHLGLWWLHRKISKNKHDVHLFGHVHADHHVKKKAKKKRRALTSTASRQARLRKTLHEGGDL